MVQGLSCRHSNVRWCTAPIRSSRFSSEPARRRPTRHPGASQFDGQLETRAYGAPRYRYHGLGPRSSLSSVQKKYVAAPICRQPPGLSKGDMKGVVCHKGGRRDTPSRITRPRAVAWAGGRSVGRSVGRSRARACDSSWWPPSRHRVVADLLFAPGVQTQLRGGNTAHQRGQI